MIDRKDVALIELDPQAGLELYILQPSSKACLREVWQLVADQLPDRALGALADACRLDLPADFWTRRGAAVFGEGTAFCYA